MHKIFATPSSKNVIASLRIVVIEISELTLPSYIVFPWIYGLESLANGPTCFKKLENPGCIQLHCTKKMKFSIKDFLSKCDQIRRKLRIWSHLMENFIFSAVLV